MSRAPPRKFQVGDRSIGRDVIPSPSAVSPVSRSRPGRAHSEFPNTNGEAMSRTQPDRSPAVRIEAQNEWAWCGDRRLELTPKAFAVLRHLVEHAGRLITKDELLSTIWRDAIVSDAALASVIRDVRRALQDSSRSPRYIQTAHRRGFRFIGRVPHPAAPAAEGPAHRVSPARYPSSSDAASMLVGRENELAGLQARLAKALAGERQLVFVTGEPGIGKTTL